MEVQIAVAKTNKYAVSESGDTLEVIERPNGGLSVVLADGQTSGRGAKTVSGLVVRKVISLLAEGVRDGAAARAASDSLFTERQGKVSCTLNIASIDLMTRTLVLTRNNPVPIHIYNGESIDTLQDDSSPLGIRRGIRPIINELNLVTGLTVVMYTDGLVHAGKRKGQPMDICTNLQSLMEEQDPPPQEVADMLLDQAIQLDDGRPADDMSIVILKVIPRSGDDVRRMMVRLPIN
ncbi:MAG TPA: PP2C family protein-serine/threonine phosphatase [Anaerolineales bacterium]|nr:PP2C family protein-serine/threonine phosphatase [Anaerolineales bacterium]